MTRLTEGLTRWAMRGRTAQARPDGQNIVAEVRAPVADADDRGDPVIGAGRVVPADRPPDVTPRPEGARRQPSSHDPLWRHNTWT